MRRSIAASILLLVSLAAHANVELTITSNRTTFPVSGVQRGKNDKKVPDKQTIHLAIGTRWVQWDDGSSSGVYDFEKRTLIRVDAKAKRLDEESLYAALSGRAMELDNRMMLGGALQAGSVKNNPMAPTLVEHQLSLRRDANRLSAIERKGGDGQQRYLWQNQELFAYSSELVPLPAAARDLYIRYLRYSVGGHPQILADLQKLDGIPKWIRWSDPGYGDSLRLEVIEKKETPEKPYVLPALEKATLHDPGVAAAAAFVFASTPESRAAAAGRVLAGANAAADGGKPLEAFLGYLEGPLMTGSEMPPDFKKSMEVLAQDANVKALLGALRPPNAEQAQSAVATLTRLAALAGDKAYVAGVFRANVERDLGNGEEAKSLLVAALAKNPFLAGVWKDLGDALDTGYDAADTWRCYAIARQLAPAHPLLADVDHRQSALATQYPEFF